jgi:hypothetical protein
MAAFMPLSQRKIMKNNQGSTNLNTSTSIAQKISVSQLIDGLGLIPGDWALTPLRGNKAPYRTDWQYEAPLPRTQIIADIKSGKAKGYGVRTGQISGGILAIDFDGASAMQKALELSGGESLPETVSFISNRPGREQRLYLIPQEYWKAICTKKLKTGIIGDDGKPEQLELRWNGCQSVLPPSAHPDTGGYCWKKSPQEIAIAPAPMWVIEQMLDEPAADSATTRHPDKIQLPVDVPIPLSACLTHRSRDMLATRTAAPDKGRNDSGLELARDLIGTANYLASLGQPVVGNAEDLFFTWCQDCGLASDKPKNQPQSIWKSANKGNPQPGSGKEGVEACVRGHYWNHHIKPSRRGSGGGSGSGGNGSGGNGSGNGKIVTHPAFKRLSNDDLRASIVDLIQQGLPEAEISLRLSEISKSAGYSDFAIRKIHQDFLKETEVEESRADAANLIDSLLRAKQASVPLHSVLPTALADPFARYASWLNIRPEVILLTFLATVSGLHHSQTTSLLNRDFGFDVKPNLFLAIVASSSQKKSPILNAIAKKPLRVLERKARDEWRHLQSVFNEIRELYNSLPKDQKEQQFPDGLPPEPPNRRKIYSFTDTTSEGIRNQIEAYPEQGLIGLPDELARLIKSANKYRGGKGSDEEDLLSYYDGGGETVLRADGLAGDFDNLLLSILGSIQPGVLQGMLKDCQDENGKWARFIFVSQPLAPSVMSADGGSFDLTPMLSDLYEKVNNLSPLEYKPSREAFTYYCSVYNELERRRCSEPHTGLSAAWGKAEGRVGKLACNLHVIHELVAGKIPSEFIPKARYEEATAITMFGMQQLFSLYTELGEEDALANHLIKVIHLSQEKGGFIKAKEVQALYNTKYRPTPDSVRSWFRELEAMGKGTTRGSGRSLEFSAVENPTNPTGKPQNPGGNPKVGKVDVLVDVLPTAGSVDIQGFQPKVGKVDVGGRFLKKTEECVKTRHYAVLIPPDGLENPKNCPLTSTLPTNAQNIDWVRVPAVDVLPTETSTFETGVEYEVEVVEEEEEVSGTKSEPEVTASSLPSVACDNNQNLEGNLEENEEDSEQIPTSPLTAATLRMAAIAARAAKSKKVSEAQEPAQQPAQETTAQPTPAPTPSVQIKIGSRVRYLGKGSARYGMVGTVRAVAGNVANIWLDYHSSLPGHLRDLEAILSQLELVE